jgi:hypothetical protein
MPPKSAELFEYVPSPASLKGKVERRPADESWEALRRAAWETADPDRRS